MKPLTDRQRQVLEILIRTTEDGCQATARELCLEIGFVSTNAYADFIDRLETKGFIRRPSVEHRSRSITVLLNPDGSRYVGPATQLAAIKAALGCTGRTFGETLTVAVTVFAIAQETRRVA